VSICCECSAAGAANADVAVHCIDVFGGQKKMQRRNHGSVSGTAIGFPPLHSLFKTSSPLYLFCLTLHNLTYERIPNHHYVCWQTPSVYKDTAFAHIISLYVLVIHMEHTMFLYIT